MSAKVLVRGASLEVPRNAPVQRLARQILHSALIGPKKNDGWCKLLLQNVAEGRNVDLCFRAVVVICQWYEDRITRQLGNNSCAYLQEDLKKIREYKELASRLAAEVAVNGNQLIAG